MKSENECGAGAVMHVVIVGRDARKSRAAHQSRGVVLPDQHRAVRMKSHETKMLGPPSAAGVHSRGSADVAWDASKEIRPAYINEAPDPRNARTDRKNLAAKTGPAQQTPGPFAPAFNGLLDLSDSMLRRRALHSFYSGQLDDARNCYLLLLIRDPGNETYQRDLETVVLKMRSQKADGTLAAFRA